MPFTPVYSSRPLAAFAAMFLSMLPTSINAQGKPVSYVDHSKKEFEKFVLRVGETPFYMTNVQIRLDKLRYSLGWEAEQREAIIARAAQDNFNTVSIPIHWREFEPKKDVFDTTIVDEYLGLCKKYGLKMELLWFGSNSGGHVQPLGRNVPQFRTPDYVFYSPGRKSTETTSEYSIRRDGSPNTLDLNDKDLRRRETMILRKLMDHIASWDRANGSTNVVIGVQLGNEVRGMGEADFSGELCVSYMDAVGKAVKDSPYVVWTRMNCVWGEHTSRIQANEKLRKSSGTNVDFVGIDLYTTDPKVIREILPKEGKNYRMIMECGAEVSNAAQLQLAALAGDNAYDHYDMVGTDGHGLYDAKGLKFEAHGDYVEEVRTVNRLLNSANQDVATKSHGKGLFVHNWNGASTKSTAGIDGIEFHPDSPSSQAISIRRSATEILLLNVKGGSFTYKPGLRVTGASKGRYEGERWVDEGSIPFSETSITPPPGTVVRLTRR